MSELVYLYGKTEKVIALTVPCLVTALAAFGLAFFHLEDDLDFSRFWGFFLFSCHILIFQDISELPLS